MNDTIKLIKSLNLHFNEPIVLACSYGPDSMYLLNILLSLNLNVIVAHVNHKIRTESEEEYKLLKKYCEEKNITFEYHEINEYPKGNWEEEARKIRYCFFEEILKKYDSKYLFTAHHGDDLIETILMRLSRGSSLEGYLGFKKIKEKESYKIIRPLIYLTKSEIIKYNDENNIPYALDYTNNDCNYTRNKIRHNILPVLKEISPNVHKKFIKFSENIDEYNSYINNETNIYYEKLYSNNRLDLNEINILPLLLKKNLLRKILFNIYKNDISKINDRHLNLIINLIDNEKSNSYINLPNNLKVTKFYNILEFKYYENEENNYDFILNKKVEINNSIIYEIEDNINDKSNYILRLNSGEISLPIHVRTKKVSDIMEVKHMKGRKKINRIFIDSKIPLEERNTYPIITDNDDNILWIPGIKKSKFDKQYNETYDIILKYEKRRNK